MERLIMLAIVLRYTEIVPRIAIAQYLSFTYDEAGNRIVREVSVLPASEEVEFELKSTSSIDGLSQAAEIKVYPNPTKDFFYVESDGSYVKSDLRLFDVTGRLIAGRIVKENVEMFDISSFPDGLYILEISGEHDKSTFKILKY